MNTFSVQLPAELALGILAHLDGHDLSSCALVSKAWSYPAQTLLFQDLELAVADPKPQASNMEESGFCWSALLNILHNPAIRGSVRSLRVSSADVPDNLPRELFACIERVVVAIRDIPSRLFKAFPALQKLVIDLSDRDILGGASAVRQREELATTGLDLPQSLAVREVQFEQFTAAHALWLDALAVTDSSCTIAVASFYQAWRDPLPGLERFLSACPNLERLMIDLSAAGSQTCRVSSSQI
jgi:hypothetical protein